MMTSAFAFLCLALAAPQTPAKPDSADQSGTTPISLNQAAVEVTAILRQVRQTPTLLPPALSRKIESVVNRIDWYKEQIHKGAKILAEPKVDKESNQPNIIWEAYALVYAAQDVKLKRAQLTDTMLCRFWPVDSAAKLEALKKTVDANRVKSGKDRGAIKSPVQWQNVTVTTNEELMSKSWPWIKDNLSGRLTLAPVYIEEMAAATPPPSSKVYFDWWNEREVDSGSP